MKSINYLFRTIIIILFLFGCHKNTYSQENESEVPVFKEINPLTRQHSYQVAYKLGYYMPLAGTKSYISNGSIMPLNFSFEYVLPKKYSFGIDLSQQYFMKSVARNTYQYDGSFISSNQERTLKLNSYVFTFNNHFREINKTLRPYLQIGLGVTKIDYLNYWGLLVDEKKRYSPSLTTAIGFKINLDKTNNWIIDYRIKYQIAPFKYDFISKINYVSSDISLGFRWWKE